MLGCYGGPHSRLLTTYHHNAIHPISTGSDHCENDLGGLTFTKFAGTGVDEGPFPVLSMYFFKSVLRNSKTCKCTQTTVQGL
jgi:hypothetical protein